MLVKNCAGALTFWGDKVFLLKDDKGEWTFPKTIIRMNELPGDAALRSLRENVGITARIISTAGHVSYEISSKTQCQPIYNKIFWYVMTSQKQDFLIHEEKGFTKGGYFPLEEAIKILTRNHHKAILNLLSKEVTKVASKEVASKEVESKEIATKEAVTELVTA